MPATPRKPSSPTLSRGLGREQDLPPGPPAALLDRVVLSDDPEAHAARLRHELEDEFLAHLIDREEALADEAASLHRMYAELHADRDRVHREFAAVWADRQRLLEGASSPISSEDADA